MYQEGLVLLLLKLKIRIINQDHPTKRSQTADLIVDLDPSVERIHEIEKIDIMERVAEDKKIDHLRPTDIAHLENQERIVVTKDASEATAEIKKPLEEIVTENTIEREIKRGILVVQNLVRHKERKVELSE